MQLLYSLAFRVASVFLFRGNPPNVSISRAFSISFRKPSAVSRRNACDSVTIMPRAVLFCIRYIRCARTRCRIRAFRILLRFVSRVKIIIRSLRADYSTVYEWSVFSTRSQIREIFTNFLQWILCPPSESQNVEVRRKSFQQSARHSRTC